MKKESAVSVLTIGLAIFTMLFGAGNIIYPIKTGVVSGSKIYIGILGFLITSVLLPVLGLVSMILFDGDYKIFFNRIGKIPGFFAIMFCMLIMGPILVMPRCITLPYDILAPFIPNISLSVFSALFTIVTFILTYKESKMLDIMGKYMSWALMGSLGLIIIIGLYNSKTLIYQPMASSSIFFEQVLQGFKTCDLLGALIFAYIIVKLLKMNASSEFSQKKMVVMCLKGGIIAGSIMTAFYLGFSFLGAYYSDMVSINMNGAQIFRTIVMHIMGQNGVLLLAIAVILACISTLAALAAVFADYLRNDIFKGKISYIQSLLIGLIITTLISNFGLSNIIKYSNPVIDFGYPIIVCITLCNTAYKLFNMQAIKIPVLITTLAMVGVYIYPHIV